MAIGSAIKRASADPGPRDGLLGLTGSTVTVRFGSVIYTYREGGQTLYAKAA